MQASQQLNKSKYFCRALLRQRVKAALVFLAVVAFFGLFWLAANGKIDIGRWLVPCGFKQKYGLPCPTCGMTTSVLAFVRGKVFGRDGAFYIQPAAALLCSVLVVVAFLAFLMAVFGVYFGFIKRFFAEAKIKYIILVLIIIIAAGWAVTLARALAAHH